jgi:hypothetical protein
VIQTYDDETKVKRLIMFAKSLLDGMRKKKIEPCRSLYTKIVKSCSRPFLHKTLKDLIFNKNLPSHIFNSPVFANAYMNGIYDNDQNLINEEDTKRVSTKFFFKQSIMNIRNSIFSYDGLLILTNQLQLQLDSTIFLAYDYCPNCLKRKSKAKLTIEEILGGFKKDRSSYYTVCNLCLVKVYPRLYMINTKHQTLDNIEWVNLISPAVLLKEVDNLIRNNGDKYFYTSEYFRHKDHKQIFWNIVFYFQLLKLPRFVLYILRDEAKITKLIDHLDELEASNKQTTFELKKSQTLIIGGKNSENGERKNSSASNDMASVFSFPTLRPKNQYEETIQNKM